MQNEKLKIKDKTHRVSEKYIFLNSVSLFINSSLIIHNLLSVVDSC